MKQVTKSLRVVPAAVTRVRAVETRLADLTARVCPAPVAQTAPVASIANAAREVVAEYAAAAASGCIWRLYDARDALRALVESLPRVKAREADAICALADVEEALWELDPFEDFLSGAPDYDEYDADELVELERGV